MNLIAPKRAEERSGENPEEQACECDGPLQNEYLRISTPKLGLELSW
jgi:hypothetical protein